MDSKNKITNGQRGFSLLEILLAVAVMAGLTAGAAVIFDDWAKDTVNRKVASEMQRLQLAAEEYTELNFEEIVTNDVPNVGNVAEIDIADIVDNGFLPNNFEARNSFKQALRILVRNVDDNATNGSVIEVITVGDDIADRDSRMDNGRLFDSATAGGPNIGLISSLDLGDNCCDGNIQSAYGAWSVPIADFAALYNPSPDNAQGGYMAAYGRVSVRELADTPFLFRIEVPGSPELNKMTTNLDMNGNDITNAGVIVSDSMNVAGNATFEGVETNDLQSTYVLSVRDNLDIGQNMNVLSSGGEKGDVIVRGDDTADNDFTLTGSLNVLTDNGTADGNIAAGDIFASTLSDVQTGTFSEASFANGDLDAGNIFVTNTLTRGDIQSQSLQTSRAQNVDTINAANAVAGSTTLTSANPQINGHINADGNIAIRGGANISGTVSAREQARIENLNCTNGCP